MKKLFTTPIRLFAAAGVLVGAGVAVSYALEHVSDPAAALSKAPVFKAPSSPSEVTMQQTYLQVNGMRLAYNTHYAIQPGKEVYLYNKTEVPEGYEDKIYPFVCSDNYNWSNYFNLATMASRYSASIVPNSNPEFITPNKSVKFIYTPTEEVVDKRFWLGVNSITEDIQGGTHGSLYLSAADVDLIPNVSINNKASETGAIVYAGDKITIAHSQSLPGKLYGLRVNIPEELMVPESQGWDTREYDVFNTYFTVAGKVGETYTIAAHPWLRTPETDYTDAYFDVTVRALLNKAPGMEVDGVAVTAGNPDNINIATGSKIKLTNSNSYKGAGYRPAMLIESSDIHTVNITDIAVPGSIAYNDDENTVEFTVNRDFPDGVNISTFWNLTADYLDVDFEYCPFYFQGGIHTELPVLYVDGKKMESGCTIVSGSKIEFRNPNTYQTEKPDVYDWPDVLAYVAAGENETNVNIRRIGLAPYSFLGSSEITIDTYNGNVSMYAGKPTDGFATIYIGTERGYNVSNNTAEKYIYRKESFQFKIVPRPVQTPYVMSTASGAKIESGKTILRGIEIKTVNPNTFKLGSGDKSCLYLLNTVTTDWNEFALEKPSYNSTTGDMTFKVGGENGTTHSILLSLMLTNENQSSCFEELPNAESFTFTTTDQLPDPVFSIKGEWYDVQPGQAYGIPGVNVVRANITNGVNKATACYDYHPSDDGTEPDVHGNNDVIEAAFLHGEGYKSSNVVFTRLNGQAPYALQGAKIYCNGKEISNSTYVYAGDILTVEDPNYYYGVTNDGVEALPKTFVDDMTINSANYKNIEEGKYQLDWFKSELTYPNPTSVDYTAVHTVRSNASAAFKSIEKAYTVKFHPYFPVVSTTGETSGLKLKQNIAIGSTVYVYNNFLYNVDWEYDWHCDIEGEEPTAPNTFPAAIMLEGSQAHHVLPGGGMNAPEWDTFVLSAEPNKEIRLVMYLTRKDDPSVATNRVIYTITPKAEVLKEPTLSTLGSRDDVKEGDDVYMGSTLVVTNNNSAEAGHVTVNITKDGKEVPLAQFCGGTEPELDADGSMNLLVGDSTGEYTITIGMEVSEDFAELTGAPAPVSTTVNVVKWKANEWELIFDGEDYYPEDDTVPFVSYEGYIEIINTNRSNKMPFSMGSSRPIVPVVYIDGIEMEYESSSTEFGLYGLTDYGEHTLSVGYKPHSSFYKTEWFDFPEPMEVKFVLADEVLEAPYVEVDGNPLMDLTVTNWSKIRIINPNDVPGVMSLVSFVGNESMQLEDIAYNGEVKELTKEEDGVNGIEFTLLDENCSSLMLELEAVVISGDTKYYAPKGHAAFNVELYQLLPPAVTHRVSGSNHWFELANTTNSNVATCTVHYTSYNESELNKDFAGTIELTGSNSYNVNRSDSNAHRFIVGAYLTAPGCINSEPAYATYQNGQHTLTEPRLYVHNRPLSVYDLLAPGDVI
ncbi:MAG: hypothetical protein K2M55_02110, partial [Muribaculaceae bacterium]|nr:hypothetical protein [Muribaculaceae bacterium]